LEGIELCKKYRFNSFCVNPNALLLVVEGLKGIDVEPSVVLDFPFGAGTPAIKIAAAEDMVRRGAKALDMVIDIGALKDKNYKLVTEEIKNLVNAAQGAKTKIIIEVAYLSKQDIIAACKCVEEGGGSYVKSSTGRAPRGPSMAEVKLMRDSVSPHIGVKVAGTGAFWTPQVALGAILAGADLIGTRAGAQIIDELPLMMEIYYGKNIKVVK
jgi:deoxyribose-phosphate aldolase